MEDIVDGGVVGIGNQVRSLRWSQKVRPGLRIGPGKDEGRRRIYAVRWVGMACRRVRSVAWRGVVWCGVILSIPRLATRILLC